MSAARSHYRPYDGPAEILLTVAAFAGVLLFVGAWALLLVGAGPASLLGYVWEAGGTTWILAIAGAVLLALDRHGRRRDFEEENRRRYVRVDPLAELVRMEEDE